MFTRAPVISLADAISTLRTRPRCLLCDRVLSPQEREDYTSFCADDVPGLLIRFEPAPEGARASG